MTFCIFDAAARFEQIRFVNERSGKAGILARGKETLEQFRKPVRVDDEFCSLPRLSNDRARK